MPAKAVLIFDPSGQPLKNAEVILCTDNEDDVLPLTNRDGYSISGHGYSPVSGYLKVVADGYKNYLQLIDLDGQNQEIHINAPGGPPNTIHLPSLSFSKPSRDRIINVKANLCTTYDALDVPIFEPYIDWLIVNDVNRAQDWVNRLKQNGSTHINLALTGDYNENLGWCDRYPIPGTDWTNDLSGFGRILNWVQSQNLIPIIKLGFDGQTYSGDGWTYGWRWGMDNLPRIANALSGFVDNCLWSTGFDGCFPDWSPEQTVQMVKRMRDVLGNNAQIDTEFAGGYIHLGQGARDWHNNQLDLLDHFSLELDYVGPSEEEIGEIATRLLGPKCLIGPRSPWYLEELEKSIAINFYETLTYQTIRKKATYQDSINYANVGKKYGFTVFGSGVPQE